jgi:hypothetical protein
LFSWFVDERRRAWKRLFTEGYIGVCLSVDSRARPSFEVVYQRIETLNFKVTHNVDSSTVRTFVSDIVREEAYFRAFVEPLLFGKPEIPPTTD